MIFTKGQGHEGLRNLTEPLHDCFIKHHKETQRNQLSVVEIEIPATSETVKIKNYVDDLHAMSRSRQFKNHRKASKVTYLFGVEDHSRQYL